MGYEAKIAPNYTYEDYVQWDGHWELIDGLAIAMSPMAIPEHQRIASHLNALFFNVLDKNPCNCTVYHPLDFKVNRHTTLNPDLLIVCKPITKKFLDFAPNLVVEIHSPSTIEKDKTIKFEIYEKEKIPYYLMVDPNTKEIHLFELDKKGKYQEIPHSNQMNLSKECTIKVDFENIWI